MATKPPSLHQTQAYSGGGYFRAVVQPPIEMPQLPVGGEAAGRYADLSSIRADLDHVIAASTATLDLVREDRQRSDYENLLARGLWESAAISYRRCFTSGRSHLENARESRPTLTESLSGLAPDLRANHEQMLEHANRHIAHRVNTMQGLKVLMFLSAPPSPPRAEGIAPFTVSYLCPPPEGIKVFLQVVDWLVRLLDAELELLFQELIDKANSNLPWCYSHARPQYPDRSPSGLLGDQSTTQG